jgi:hypothetical protein
VPRADLIHALAARRIEVVQVDRTNFRASWAIERANVAVRDAPRDMDERTNFSRSIARRPPLIALSDSVPGKS